MSMLRLAFWLALLVLLLPTDAQQQARFSNFATNAMQRLTTFCDRNSTSCTVGEQAWSTFVKKAEFGVRLVGDLLGAGGRQMAAQVPQQPTGPQGPGTGPSPGSALGPGPGSGGGSPPYDRRPGRADPRGTLSPPDQYQPPWRGPARP
jgi:hypothetical protein